MENLKSYIEEHKDRFLEELYGLIRIPSISSQSEHKEDMLKAAEYWHPSQLGALGYAAGLAISWLFDLPSGAVITWMLAIFAFLFRVMQRKSIKKL